MSLPNILREYSRAFRGNRSPNAIGRVTTAEGRRSADWSSASHRARGVAGLSRYDPDGSCRNPGAQPAGMRSGEGVL